MGRTRAIIFTRCGQRQRRAAFPIHLGTSGVVVSLVGRDCAGGGRRMAKSNPAPRARVQRSVTASVDGRRLPAIALYWTASGLLLDEHVGRVCDLLGDCVGKTFTSLAIWRRHRRRNHWCRDGSYRASPTTVGTNSGNAIQLDGVGRNSNVARVRVAGFAANG